MWTKTEDDSVVDSNGKVIWFSTRRFVEDICLGDCCFICGAKPGEKAFNNEHVVPEWILRRYDLFARTINLPNGVAMRYDRYTVPCCADCNTLMGDEIETPVSKVVQAGPNAINEFAEKGQLLKLFVWMGLIFLKTHLKDRAFRFHLDARKGGEKIADIYEWEQLHHLHSVVRCFYNDCYVEREAIGSFLSHPVKLREGQEAFDFGDLYAAQTMMLRFNTTAIIAVFNDSGGAMSYFWQKLEKITGPVSDVQVREIMCELAYLNLHLKDRPQFATQFDLANETSRIVAMRPTLALADLDRSVRGKLLEHMLARVLPYIDFNVGKERALEAIKAGTFTFLFDDDGKFIGEQFSERPQLDKSAKR